MQMYLEFIKMTTEELKQYLKDNLNISLSIENIPSSWGSKNVLRVTIEIEEEFIAEGEINLNELKYEMGLNNIQ